MIKYPEALVLCSSCVNREVSHRDEPCFGCLKEFPKNHCVFVEQDEHKDREDIIHDGGCKGCSHVYGDIHDGKTEYFICDSCKRKIAWCYGGDGDELCNYCWGLRRDEDGSE